jgi:ankyrin repeat protein
MSPLLDILFDGPWGDAKREEFERVMRTSIDIDAVDEEGRTALMIAAADAPMYYTARLVEEGANVQLKDYAGLTAEDYARGACNYELADYLHLHSPNTCD